MKLALIHEYLTHLGGAEQNLSVFTEMYPEAPIYTLLYNEKATKGAFANKKIETSFLQHVPFAKTHHRLFPALMPVAIEQFDLSAYDVVLSNSHSYAKGVITRPNTMHVCYCQTPMRYAWDDSHKYVKAYGMNRLLKKFVAPTLNYVRVWDRVAADRVDRFVANSAFVAKRIKKYYGVDAAVIHSPVSTDQFAIGTPQDYFLIVSRLLQNKRVDLVIETFNELGLPLVIIGTGPEERRLRAMANDNIRFLGFVSNEERKKYLSEAKAFIFPQEEDFGLTPVEAMASGRPVIAYKAGGALETVVEGKTGVFFDTQTPQHVAAAVRKIQQLSFDPQTIRSHAEQFSVANFKRKMSGFIDEAWQQYTR